MKTFFMNTCQIKENDILIRQKKRESNPIEKQYNRVFGKKETYSDNEIFVFNAMRTAQKIIERYED